MKVANPKERIEQTERVALDAVCALQKAGLDREAERLRRKLGKV